MTLAEVSYPLSKYFSIAQYTVITVGNHGQRRKINLQVGRTNIIAGLDTENNTVLCIYLGA